MSTPAPITPEIVKHVGYCDAVDGYVHSWETNCPPRGIILYVHGLQSHSAWAWELASSFVRRGYTFISLDRRGSGLSPENHTEFPNAEVATQDYARFINFILASNPSLPVLAIGHCLGGSVLTATLATAPHLAKKLSKVAIVSSWLNKLHTMKSPTELDALRNDVSDEMWDVGLTASDFTDSPDYQRFIIEDPLAVRKITRRSRRNILQREDMYGAWKAPTELEVQFITSINDPVIDVPSAAEQARTVYGSNISLHFFGEDKHFIPFTGFREALVTQVAEVQNDIT